jgi:hypothetical protein
VEGARYFVTVRCADSLPLEAVRRLKELTAALNSSEPHSIQFAALQRESFRTAEKYLDAGYGSCPLVRHDASFRIFSPPVPNPAGHRPALLPSHPKLATLRAGRSIAYA